MWLWRTTPGCGHRPAPRDRTAAAGDVPTRHPIAYSRHDTTPGTAMTRLLMPFAFTLLAAASLARADEPQTMTARIGDIAFESGDEEITFVPSGSAFSLSASTKGAAAWPPPKTRIDRLGIVCDGFEDGKPLVIDHKAFEHSTCDVTFHKGTKPMGGEPEASWSLDKNATDNRLEITRANGKIYEGTFSFRLKDDHGGALTVTNGHFKIEDRQL